MESNEEMAIRGMFAELLRTSREEARMSQQEIAQRLGVSKTTVQNWELSISSPSVMKLAEWFIALGIQPLPYCLRAFYPLEFTNIDKANDDELDKALQLLIRDMPVEQKRKLLYIFYGDHGSSAISVMNMVVAHLKTPLISRIGVASLIVSNYELAAGMGRLVGDKDIAPDMHILTMAIQKAKEAVYSRGRGYTTLLK